MPPWRLAAGPARLGLRFQAQLHRLSAPHDTASIRRGRILPKALARSHAMAAAPPLAVPMMTGLFLRPSAQSSSDLFHHDIPIPLPTRPNDTAFHGTRSRCSVRLPSLAPPANGPAVLAALLTRRPDRMLWPGVCSSYFDQSCSHRYVHACESNQNSTSLCPQSFFVQVQPCLPP